jgi:hypothetical protein
VVDGPSAGSGSAPVESPGEDFGVKQPPAMAWDSVTETESFALAGRADESVDGRRCVIFVESMLVFWALVVQGPEPCRENYRSLGKHNIDMLIEGVAHHGRRGTRAALTSIYVQEKSSSGRCSGCSPGVLQLVVV